MASTRSSRTRVYDQCYSPGIHGEEFSLQERERSLTMELDNQPLQSDKRLIIAIDFGTTYSAISYIAVRQSSRYFTGPNDVRSVASYPGSWNYYNNEEVPTEVLYPLNSAFREQGHLEPVHNTSGDSMGEDQLNGFDFNLDIEMENVQLHESDNSEMVPDDPNQFTWGYKVHELWCLPATHSDSSNRPLSRFKLLLDESPMTQPVRDALLPTLNALQKKRIIRKPLDVIADYLTYLLRHAKSELDKEKYDESYRREIVLCVPAIWTERACRQMQAALAIAMRNSAFQYVSVENSSIENLFIVSEPEASAAYMLSINSGLVRGDVFVLLDAGGGTVDANTYEISSRSPLRLSREVVPPGGGLHGSSYINQGLREYLRSLLKDEGYLETKKVTIDGIIETIVMDAFEHRFKRTFNIYQPENRKFPILGLRDNHSKRFKDGYVDVPANVLQAIFLKQLRSICGIMEGQITTAMQRNCRVQKVLVIGGFALSVSLRNYLRTFINRFNDSNGCKIQVDFPEQKNKSNAVSCGAVLRALNKEKGPNRIARSSYGVMRTELRNEHKEHEGVRPWRDPCDGLFYIRNTINWFLELGTTVPPVCEFEFPCCHLFKARPPCPLICEEKLYVSDVPTRSHFRLSDPVNNRAEKIGEIIVDFTYLRDEGVIKPIDPEIDETGKKKGLRHYEVIYDLVIKIVDRDLECLAIYDKRVKKKCRINIAPGFLPGVK